MTTEEKARAYDEALTTAKRIISKNCSEVEKLCLKCVFPQLTESEDERIRKEIISTLKFANVGGIYDKHITYLENQKPSFKQIHDSITWDRGLRAGIELEKQQEQKPVEWDEDTKTNLDRALQIIKKAKGTLQGYQSDDGIYECDKAIECLEHFLYRGLETEKSVEWSKNDTVFLNEITDFFENKTVRLQHELNMYAHWLKSLPERFILQPKQERQIKEGDKVSIHCRKDRREDITIIYDGEVGEVIHVWDAKKHPWGHIIVQLNNGCNTGFYEDELEVLDEPHWKPSKISLEALHTAVYLPEMEFYGGLKDKLCILYEQLKKLGVREEPEYYQHFDPDC